MDIETKVYAMNVENLKMRKLLPKNFEKRIVTGFLIFPTILENELRWLETATWEEEYFRSSYTGIAFWEKTKWVKKE